ncbi:hypothetical protein [Rhizobium straminoryzae]|uniref:Uncharacterized protein n=1 Tax=Rhizobium straminoryzae TaxID=1387186 RepID=A0A549TCJ9_9HYPH|nr:hypothetical protein [Rhizobium straminoryzae]TRL39586.1 hypothetical protein FNA46_08520 [Rhizobium straminoryzae]
MNKQIFTVMEFSGRGDAMFGGSAADWSLYTQEDGSNAFMSTADAQRRQLVKAYFPTKKEASEAGEAASQRKGLISALPVRRVDEIPYAQLRWIVGNMHVGTSDDDLKADIKGRAKSGMVENADLLAQACAYALASHRANQGLVAHFRL